MRRNEINRTCMAVREREREQEKTCSVFDAENGVNVEKIININNTSIKLDNIELGYVRIAKCY